MTKKEREIIKKVCDKIEYIVHYHSKNLTQKQYADLDECEYELYKLLRRKNND